MKRALRAGAAPGSPSACASQVTSGRPASTKTKLTAPQSVVRSVAAGIPPINSGRLQAVQASHKGASVS